MSNRHVEMVYKFSTFFRQFLDIVVCRFDKQQTLHHVCTASMGLMKHLLHLIVEVVVVLTQLKFDGHWPSGCCAIVLQTHVGTPHNG